MDETGNSSIPEGASMPIEPQRGDVVFDYDHFYQLDPKWQDPKYGPVLRPKTMCWIACLTMGIQALHPEMTQEDAYKKSMAIYSGKSLKERIDDMEKSGEDVRMHRAYLKEIGPIIAGRGGLKSQMPEQRPQEFKKLVNHIFSAEGLNIEIDVIPPQKIKTKKVISQVKKLMRQGKILIANTVVYDEEHKIVRSHSEVWGGYRKGSFKISDPGLKNPEWASESYLPNLTKGIKAYDDSGYTLALDPKIGIYFFKRSKNKKFFHL